MPWGLYIASLPVQTAKPHNPDELCRPASPSRDHSYRASKRRQTHCKRTLRMETAPEKNESSSFPIATVLPSAARNSGIESGALTASASERHDNSKSHREETMDDTGPCTLPELTAVFRFRQWKRQREEALRITNKTQHPQSSDDKEVINGASREHFLVALAQLRSWQVSSYRGGDTGFPSADDFARVLSSVVSYVSLNVVAQSPSMLSLIAGVLAQYSFTNSFAALRPHCFFVDLLFNCRQNGCSSQADHSSTGHLCCASSRVTTLCAAIASASVDEDVLVETVVNVAERAFQTEGNPWISCANPLPSSCHHATPTPAQCLHPSFALGTFSTPTTSQPFQSPLFRRLITDAPLIPLLQELSASVREQASSKVVEIAARLLLGSSADATVPDHHQLLRYETTLLDELLHS